MLERWTSITGLPKARTASASTTLVWVSPPGLMMHPSARPRSSSSASTTAPLQRRRAVEAAAVEQGVLPGDVARRAAEQAHAEQPGGTHPQRHRLAMVERPAECRGRLERMAHGVPVVQDRARAGLSLVGGDHLTL